MSRVKAGLLFLLATIIAGSRALAQDAPPTLREFCTCHYHVHTDLDHDLTADLGNRLDQMYDEYSRRLSEFSAPADGDLLEVYLVHTQARYLRLAGFSVSGTGGSYNSQRRLLAAFLDGQGRDVLRRTLQHEAFHQFADRAIGPALPIWLNEGLAQIFEEGIFTGNSFELGQVPPARLRQLQRDIDSGDLLDFKSLLSQTPEQWARAWRDPELSATQYNQAWAMTHFLIYATDEQKQFKYRERLMNMLHRIRAGETGLAAFTESFSANFDAFHDRFIEYTRQLDPTAHATLIEHQAVLADILSALRSRGEPINTFDEFKKTCLSRRWQMHYRRGTLQWDSESDPAVYFRDPDGHSFTANQLSFEFTIGRSCPDLVCHTADGLTLRTQFLPGPQHLDHETLIASSDAQ